PPAAAQAHDVDADDANLWRAFRRFRRPHPGNVRNHLAVWLGAARGPAEAAGAWFGAPTLGRCARGEGNSAAARRRSLVRVEAQPSGSMWRPVLLFFDFTTASSNER